MVGPGGKGVKIKKMEEKTQLQTVSPGLTSPVAARALK